MALSNWSPVGRQPHNPNLSRTPVAPLRESGGLLLQQLCINRLLPYFSDLITTATEYIKRVTISSVLPSTSTQDDKIQEINNFIRNKCRDIGAKFVDNDNNFLFRAGSCDTSAFKSDGVYLSANGVEKLVNNLSLRHLSHRNVGTGYNKARPTGNSLRNNNEGCRLLLSCLKKAAIRRMQLGSDHRNTNAIRQILAQLGLVTVSPLDTCVLQASVTSVVRQITSPRLADM